MKVRYTHTDVKNEVRARNSHDAPGRRRDTGAVPDVVNSNGSHGGQFGNFKTTIGDGLLARHGPTFRLNLTAKPPVVASKVPNAAKVSPESPEELSFFARGDEISVANQTGFNIYANAPTLTKLFGYTNMSQEEAFATGYSDYLASQPWYDRVFSTAKELWTLISSAFKSVEFPDEFQVDGVAVAPNVPASKVKSEVIESGKRFRINSFPTLAATAAALIVSFVQFSKPIQPANTAPLTQLSAVAYANIPETPSSHQLAVSTVAVNSAAFVPVPTIAPDSHSATTSNTVLVPVIVSNSITPNPTTAAGQITVATRPRTNRTHRRTVRTAVAPGSEYVASSLPVLSVRIGFDRTSYLFGPTQLSVALRGLLTLETDAQADIARGDLSVVHVVGAAVARDRGASGCLSTPASCNAMDVRARISDLTHTLPRVAFALSHGSRSYPFVDGSSRRELAGAVATVSNQLAAVNYVTQFTGPIRTSSDGLSLRLPNLEQVVLGVVHALNITTDQIPAYYQARMFDHPSDSMGALADYLHTSEVRQIAADNETVGTLDDMRSHTGAFRNYSRFLAQHTRRVE